MLKLNIPRFHSHSRERWYLEECRYGDEPFNKIFNEWYAAQTSKKIRAVWKSKADKGERDTETRNPRMILHNGLWMSLRRECFVALYRRTCSYEDSAKIGRWGNLTPTAYLIANGRKAKNKISARSEYAWGTSSIEHILENRQYTGRTVNFKSSIISYKGIQEGYQSRGWVADYPEHPRSNYWRWYL